METLSIRCQQAGVSGRGADGAKSFASHDSSGASVGDLEQFKQMLEDKGGEWVAVQYLWRTKSEGVRDYLCNRAISLGDARVERFLGQLVALVISCPSASLQRLLCDLCARSSRLACKVSWLLGAMTEDGRAVDPAFVRTFKSQCDAAATGGDWPLCPETWKSRLVSCDSPLALRMEVFQGTLRVVRELCEVSTRLAAHVAAPQRPAMLRKLVGEIDAKVALLPFVYPLKGGEGTGGGGAVVRLVAEECVVLTSREKAPYLLLMEVLYDQPCEPAAAAKEAACRPPPPAAAALASLPLAVSLSVGADSRVRLQLCSRQQAAAGAPDGAPPQRSQPSMTVGGGSWAEMEARVRAGSPFSAHPRWRLMPVIVKSGDDCRQELMAVQLVSMFHSVWTEAGIPLWVRPFEVLVTSSHSALIEVITDAPSIHAVKRQLPAGTSLADHFRAQHGGDGSPSHRHAQRNFVESMAGYSIISYLFQLKDRHNGNLLLDSEGHLIHIDFSFMLANSPGGLNFESAPFKLTRELLEVMDSDAEGAPSDAFHYFKVLCIQGFLEARKQAERILLLVEMMQGSNVPCFRGGPRVVQQLRKRFHLASTEEQCVELVLSLIGDSLDAWCMRQYDTYQRAMNGIL